MTARPLRTGPIGTGTSRSARDGWPVCGETAWAVCGQVAALRPSLAAAGLGLGVAAVCEPEAEPAGPA
ncbi:hypothetical protein AB0470_36070, partial [Streptomyces griseosporeus]